MSETDGGQGRERGTISFRPMTRADFSQLSAWLSAPHVQPWWREDAALPAIEDRYGPSVGGDDPTEHFIVELEGRPVGMVQRYRIGDDPGWARAVAVAGVPTDAAGIDYLIGEESLTGQGLGTAIVGRFVEGIWDRFPDLSAVVVAVLHDNTRSWRALEKTGFERHWTGMIDSADSSDAGLSHVYVKNRPAGATGR